MTLNSMDYSLKNFKRIINIFTLVFSAILLLDMLLGVEVSEERVEHRAYYKEEVGTVRDRDFRTVIGIFTEKSEIPFREATLYNILRKGDLVEIQKSQILSEVINIRFNGIDYKEAAYSVYSYYYLFPIICIAGSVGAFFSGKLNKPFYDFFLVFSSIVTVYLLISMVTNNRI